MLIRYLKDYDAVRKVRQVYSGQTYAFPWQVGSPTDSKLSNCRLRVTKKPLYNPQTRFSIRYTVFLIRTS
jgi:hypothetical protein